ncbi:MAG: hypothetical protein JXC32_04390 [Anaerolineae bacterium]|nr:hypothetical protein [Anaerolineae bacterium]
MSRKGWLILGVVVLVVSLTVGLVAAVFTFERLPERLSQHETIVLGQSALVPGSTAAMRVVVRDSRDATPLPSASVKVLMRPAQGGRAQPLYQGETDASGTLDVRFAVPEDAAPDQVLVVETASSLGSDLMEKPVTLTRDYRLLVTTDKPLYQPGQIIHIRALALGAFDHRPASEQPMGFAVADGKGNTVFRTTVTTSVFGVASTDFQLADEVNTGPYKITVSLGETTSEKIVTVEHYTLPKFEVVVTTDRDYYQPGDSVEGSLTARYFFGKDVTESVVALEGYTFDIERNVVVRVDGQTDETGRFDFSFDLPDYFAGSELDDGRAVFYLEARVTDQANHTEAGRLSLPVAQQALVVDAIPEGGRFHPGVENILYVLASYPDGAPAEAEVTVTVYETGETLEATTGAYGLAEFGFVPASSYTSLRIQARDAAGALADREFGFEGDTGEETVLLRPDAPIYRVGDTMGLTLLTSRATGTVYLDVVREGQTVSTRAVDVTDGHAEVAVDLTPDLYGTLALHAYKILRSGHVMRDTRLVVVDQAADLDVTLAAGEDSYRPGDDATLNVAVADPAGGGVQAALGLAVVDEAVFALAEQDPGFAKLYFMLEQELLEPKFELHGFSIPDMLRDPCVEGDTEACPTPLRQAQNSAGKAALASAVADGDPFTLEANSHDQAMARAYERQRAFYRTLATGSFGLFLALPLTVLVLNGASLIRDRSFWKSVGLAIVLAILAGLSLLGVLWLVDELLWRFEDLVFTLLALAFGFGALAGLVTLVVTAIRRKDILLGLSLIVIPSALAAGVLMGWSASRADLMPDSGPMIAGSIAWLLLPVSLLLRGAGFAWEKRPLPALGAVLLGVPMLAMFVIILGLSGGAFIGGGMAMQAGFDEALMPMEAPAAGLMDRNFADGDFALEVEKMVEAEEGGPVSAPGDTGAGRAEPPRLRQYFPETMLWLPDEVTDETGQLILDFPVADSITTWRVVALASSQDGRLGSATGALRVFQDFFIDLDLPGSLTVGDEIAVPVGVYNYLPEAQTVRLEVAAADWFELVDEPVKEITIAANDITVVYFRIRALAFGQQLFQVTAYGSQMSDAIRKDVRVFPDGKELRFAVSDKLDATVEVVETVQIPADAIQGTQKLVVKIYPGVVSQVVEGLDALLRMPFGCFEQTSSTTYPNILVLDYLKSVDQVSPEVQMKAEEYINLGYQRLTTFEVPGEPGGFSLFGDAPADPMLTAYGLQEFGDMSRVYDIDLALIGRIADWLFAHQEADGSWRGVEGFHETSLTSMTGRVPVTAFIVWGLADAGYAGDGRTQSGVAFLRDQVSQVETAYDLALVANALVAVDVKVGEILSATEAVLDRLAAMAQRDGDAVFWTPGRETYMGGSGTSGQLETTAAAALAFLRAGRHSDLANEALVFLTRNKDSFGTWETTSATVLALKALLESVRAGSEDVDAAVTVRFNGQTETVEVTPETFDVVQMIVFDDVPVGRDADVEIAMSGEGNLMYQVTGSYYLPWERLSLYPDLLGGEELVSIDVVYDRAELAVNDTIGVDVTVTLNEPDGVAEQAIIDLGLPPGFDVETEDLARLVARFQDLPDDYPHAQVKRFELTGRQIILYVRNLNGAEPLQLSYRLRAKFPLVAQTPASMAYDYYNPAAAADAAPQLLTVVE